MYVFVLYAPTFLSFCKYWPDDGPLKPKLIGNIKRPSGAQHQTVAY